MSTTRAGVMLRKWISDTKTTQMKLAAELGVSQTTVSAWLAGSEALATSAGRLQELAGIPISAWGETGDESSPALPPVDESGPLPLDSGSDVTLRMRRSAGG